MSLSFRVLAGTVAAIGSIFIAVAFPAFAWTAGWLGACIYFWLVK